MDQITLTKEQFDEKFKNAIATWCEYYIVSKQIKSSDLDNVLIMQSFLMTLVRKELFDTTVDKEK